MSRRLPTLRARAEFQRVRGGGRADAAGFLMEGKPRAPQPDSPPHVGQAGFAPEVTVSFARFGFTITKKIGSAVVRNRIRRRLKAALMDLYASHAETDMDYVVVARKPAFDQPFAALKADLAAAIGRVNAAVRKRRGNRPPGASSKGTSR